MGFMKTWKSIKDAYSGYQAAKDPNLSADQRFLKQHDAASHGFEAVYDGVKKIPLLGTAMEVAEDVAEFVGGDEVDLRKACGDAGANLLVGSDEVANDPVRRFTEQGKDHPSARRYDFEDPKKNIDVGQIDIRSDE